MHKGIIAYIIIFLIILIVVLLYLRPQNLLGNHTNTTTVQPATTIKQNITSSTSTITTTQSTTIVYGTCISPNENVSIKNGNFSTGTYQGWITEGPGFGNAPLNISYANAHNGYYAAPWTGYSGNFVATTYRGGLALETGNLTSEPFRVVEPFLNFKIISPPDNGLYIEVLRGSTPVIITHFDTYAAPNNTAPTSTFENASIPLGIVMCQNVSIKVVANVGGTVTTHTDYIAVGDFYISKTPVETPGIILNQTIV